MEIAYAAHTESCTLLLDSDGYCRRIVANAGRRLEDDRVERCIGAQYVASLDVTAKGGLAQLPQPGLPLIFARMDPRSGRISLVRTGPLVRFETREPSATGEPAHTQTRAKEPPGTPGSSDLGTTRDEWEIDTRKMRPSDMPEEIEADTDERPKATWQDDTETVQFDSLTDEVDEQFPGRPPGTTTYAMPGERGQRAPKAPLPPPPPRSRQGPPPPPPPSAPTAPPPWTRSKKLVRGSR